MVTAPPRLWLVRHAPVLAAPGLCYGRSDLPADPAATQAAVQALAQQLPAGLALSTSPLQRCTRLAQELLALRPDLRPAPRPDARLQEMDFGIWEGRPWSAIARPDFDTWMVDFAHARPGGNGETVAELMARVGVAWDDWCASGQDALWITHAGVMRAALLLARGVRLPTTAGDWPAVTLALGGVLTLDRPSASV